MDITNLKVFLPILFGLPLIGAGILHLLIVEPPTGFFSEFRPSVSVKNILGIIEICAGSILLIIGIINWITSKKRYDEFIKVASESSHNKERA